jgi:hypothetical protein
MSSRADRAAKRGSWPVVVTTLAESDGLASMPVTEDGTAAWNAVIELSQQAWSLVGFPELSDDRRQWPSRKFMASEHDSDDHGR